MILGSCNSNEVVGTSSWIVKADVQEEPSASRDCVPVLRVISVMYQSVKIFPSQAKLA